MMPNDPGTVLAMVLDFHIHVMSLMDLLLNLWRNWRKKSKIKITKNTLAFSTRVFVIHLFYSNSARYSSYPSFSRSFFGRSEEHTSELQSRFDLVCRLLLEKKK